MNTALYIHHPFVNEPYCCCEDHANGTKRVGPNWDITKLEKIEESSLPCQFCNHAAYRRALRRHLKAEKAKVATVEQDLSCPKCGGSGIIHAFRHIDGGRCFRCEGSGKVS